MRGSIARVGALFALVMAMGGAGCDGAERTSDAADSPAPDANDATSGEVPGPEVADTEPQTFEGSEVYRNVLPEGNTFTCATCHALEEPAEDGIRRVAHALGDATHRPSYKDGQLVDMLDAVNTCVTGWMNAPAWSEDDPRWVALHSWLEEQAPEGAAPAVDIQIVAPPAELGGGDAVAGRALFNGACVMCHGVDAAGTERAPQLAGADLAADYIALRVRSSGDEESPIYPGLTGGIMPFWGGDRLSDDELRDAIAFLLSTQPPGPDADAVGDADAPDASDGDATVDVPPGDGPGPDLDVSSGCAKSHPKIGQVATLTTHFHNVQGEARILDDCTILLEHFTFDGNGIDVRIYGGKGGEYDKNAGGFALSEDLLNFPVGYSDETMVLTLPEGRTLDDLDGISVWCVDVGVSFGDGLFEAP
ncbi:MAG: DM13 domain-containing protein [Deltaproteobacteria bacterium]|nr:DM13 domain-containing protein [Deltaproteobacteria bacterium]